MASAVVDAAIAPSRPKVARPANRPVQQRHWKPLFTIAFASEGRDARDGGDRFWRHPACPTVAASSPHVLAWNADGALEIRQGDARVLCCVGLTADPPL